MNDHIAGENSPLDVIDERILGDLRSLHSRLDPVPSGLTDDVKFALTVQALHAEVAELQRVGVEDLLAVRSDELTRAETLTFSSGVLSAMVTISRTTLTEARIDGWITGPVAEVELIHDGGSLRAIADEDGRFVIPVVPRGFVQFIFHPDGEGNRAVITPKVEV